MLAQFGYGTEWRAAVLRMIGEVAGLGLFAGAPGLTLAGVGASGRLNEMEFHYPLHPVTPERLREVFRDHGQTGGRAFADRIGRLTFAPMQGFMRGFIDMVFRHEERYYLVDWKSNHLGDGYDAYHASRLADAHAGRNSTPCSTTSTRWRCTSICGDGCRTTAMSGISAVWPTSSCAAWIAGAVLNSASLSTRRTLNLFTRSAAP